MHCPSGVCEEKVVLLLLMGDASRRHTHIRVVHQCLTLGRLASDIPSSSRDLQPSLE
jgi:hypothetical protein